MSLNEIIDLVNSFLGKQEFIQETFKEENKEVHPGLLEVKLGKKLDKEGFFPTSCKLGPVQRAFVLRERINHSLNNGSNLSMEDIRQAYDEGRLLECIGSCEECDYKNKQRNFGRNQCEGASYSRS